MEIPILIVKAVVVYGLIAIIIFLLMREILREHWNRNQKRKE